MNVTIHVPEKLYRLAKDVAGREADPEEVFTGIRTKDVRVRETQREGQPRKPPEVPTAKIPAAEPAGHDRL
jgi:hypothetical protein